MRNAAELVLFVLLLAFLIWVPMPFGSASDAAQPLLIIPALLICAAATVLRVTRQPMFAQTRPGRLWIIGGVLFTLVIALQLLPLPTTLLGVLSPQSAAIWVRAARLAGLAGLSVSSLHPIT